MLKQITPFVPVSDVEAAVEFFTDRLGFGCNGRMAGYANITRDGASFRLVETDGEAGQPPPGPLHCYVDVEDADALYHEWAPQLDDLDEDRVVPPFDTAYGTREFQLAGPETLLLCFGSPAGRLQ